MRLFALTLLALCALPSAAMACSCVPPSMQTSRQIFEEATIIVEAEVISPGATAWMQTRPLDDQVATVRPAKFYKGALNTDEIMFAYSENTAACGIGILTEGETRLFILNQKDNRLVSASSCAQLLPAYLDTLPEDVPPLMAEEPAEGVEAKVERAEATKADTDPVSLAPTEEVSDKH